MKQFYSAQLFRWELISPYVPGTHTHEPPTNTHLHLIYCVALSATVVSSAACRGRWSKTFGRFSCFSICLFFHFHPSILPTAPLAKSETAVNYWLTWVLITMQIWGETKSKEAVGSRHIGSGKKKEAWLERLEGRFLDSRSGAAGCKKERKCNWGICFVC